jgi:hypothetical protein
MEVGEEKVKYINYSRLIQGHSWSGRCCKVYNICLY